MLDEEIIENQKSLLEIHRRNLQHLLSQVAYHGGELTTPVFIINNIRDSRTQIQKIKDYLRNLNVIINDIPEDKEDNEEKKKIIIPDRELLSTLLELQPQYSHQNHHVIINSFYQYKNNYLEHTKFYISISNNLNKQIIINFVESIVIEIKRHILPSPTPSVLNPLLTHKLILPRKLGKTLSPIIPNIKIGSGDSAAFDILLIPEDTIIHKDTIQKLLEDDELLDIYPHLRKKKHFGTNTIQTIRRLLSRKSVSLNSRNEDHDDDIYYNPFLDYTWLMHLRIYYSGDKYVSTKLFKISM